MINGWIDGRDTTARISQRLFGPNGTQSLRFEIDTGFYGDILMPIEWALLLTSDFDAVPRGVFLADGTARKAQVCNLSLDWVGGVRPVEVLAVAALASTGAALPFAGPTGNDRRGGKPHGLIGRGLLSDARLMIDWVDSLVTIKS
jgi:hypothetical protein